MSGLKTILAQFGLFHAPISHPSIKDLLADLSVKYISEPQRDEIQEAIDNFWDVKTIPEKGEPQSKGERPENIQTQLQNLRNICDHLPDKSKTRQSLMELSAEIEAKVNAGQSVNKQVSSSLDHNLDYRAALCTAFIHAKISDDEKQFTRVENFIEMNALSERISSEIKIMFEPPVADVRSDLQ
jgi:hypothetical protein